MKLLKTLFSIFSMVGIITVSMFVVDIYAQESVPSHNDDYGIIIQLAGIIGGITAGSAGVWQYRNSVKLRRAEWLYKLYHQFYVALDLKEVRQKLITQQGIKDIEEVVKKSSSDLSSEQLPLRMKVIDYFNFFEFTMFLMNFGVLSKNDVKIMFEYYLKTAKKSTIINTYLKEYGYDELHNFVNKEFS